jgi:hypothetical protein
VNDVLQAQPTIAGVSRTRFELHVYPVIIEIELHLPPEMSTGLDGTSPHHPIDIKSKRGFDNWSASISSAARSTHLQSPPNFPKSTS